MSAVVLRGDAGHLPLPDASVDLIVTSPPYWSMRSYTDDGEHYEGQIGSEETPREWLEAMWRCTSEWMRVLKSTGSMFVDLGDKYSTTLHSYNYRDPGTYTRQTPQPGGEWSQPGWHGKPNLQPGRQEPNAPPKSLMLLPERYRIGCLDRLGLIAREVIEWDKCNPLPESAKDRCGRTHEDVVHLVKQPRYFAAVDEIREPPSGYQRPNNANRGQRGAPNGIKPRTLADTCNPLGRVPGSVWSIPSMPLVVPDRIAHARCCGGRKRNGCEDGLAHYAAFPPALVTPIVLGWSPSGICLKCGEGRFPVTSRERIDIRPGYSKTHNGQREGIPQSGGTKWKTKGQTDVSILGYACSCCPYTDHPGTAGRERTGQGYARETGRDAHPHGGVGMLPRTGPWREYHLDRWTPPPTRPAVVLDPFGGTGTTSLVADVLGRIGITVDRSADYCRLARWRTSDPGERARALGVPKPPPVPEGQQSLFDAEAS